MILFTGFKLLKIDNQDSLLIIESDQISLYLTTQSSQNIYFAISLIKTDLKIEKICNYIQQLYPAIIERCKQTGLYVGYIPGFAGVHSQGETIEELRTNLTEVIEILLEDLVAV